MAERGGIEPVVVGFDTATEDTAVCAAGGGEILHESLIGLAADGSPRHSTALLGEVEKAAATAGGWGEVDLIAVGLGPGSFVGARIGVATAKALSVAGGIGARGVCTLDAIARALVERGEGSRCLVVTDARRGEVFAALYSPDGERLWGPLVEPPEALAKRLAAKREPLLVAGSGAVRFRNELVGCGVEIPDDADPVHRVAARHICAVATATGAGGAGPLAPIYLRPPDAERWRERDTPQSAD